MAKKTTEVAEAPQAAGKMTPKEFAEMVGSDPKTVRRFLRKLVGDGSNPGKGQRWTIDSDSVEELTKRFAAYSNRTARTITLSDLAEDEDDVETIDDEELEEI